MVQRSSRMPLDEIDQLKLVRPAPKATEKRQPLSDDAIRKRLKARQLIEELRSICPPERQARRKPSSHSTPSVLVYPSTV
jgi:hypothetical protein